MQGPNQASSDCRGITKANEGVMSQPESTLPTTVPILTFARIAFGLAEDTAYAAAHRGDIPTIKIGKFLRVPVRVALAKLAGGDAEALKAMTADFAAKLRQLEAEQAA
jgi:hypothetical protein